MRSVPGQNLKFDWNFAIGEVEIPPSDAYPGDAYVDYIGVNIFDNGAGCCPEYPIPEGATPQDAQARRQSAWGKKLTGAWGLDFAVLFAASHRKYLSLPEWAVVEPVYKGGGDNAFFIERMHDWITHTNLGYQAYFNGGGGLGDHRLTGATLFPNAAARYRELFGS